MEMEPGEGAAHEKGESAEEEVREGTEASEGEDSSKKSSRKRSAKGAKSTKAPMDSEGCGCGGKKGATCDGNCGSGMKKGRTDALTAPEYLAACELGIQRRSRSYIRARLDMAERLDLKCGKGSISQGEKCTKGAATKANNKQKSGVNWNTVGQVALVAGAIGVSAALGSRRQRSLQASERQMRAETSRDLSRIHSQIQANQRARRQTEANLNARTRQLNLTMRRVRTTTNNMLADLDKRIATRSAGETPFQRRMNRALTTPTLEQVGEIAQNRQAFGEFMSKPDAPLFAKSKRRKTPGTIRKRQDSTYATGFTLDPAALSI